MTDTEKVSQGIIADGRVHYMHQVYSQSVAGGRVAIDISTGNEPVA